MRVLVVLSILISASSDSIAADFPTVAHLPSLSQVEDFGGSMGAAPGKEARPLTALTLDMIKDFEGWEPAAYNDPVGYCTIGFGHLIALNKCEEVDLKQFKDKKLTPSEGEDLLEKDTRSARISVQQLVTADLNDEEFGAVSAFVFNVGKSHFADSTLLHLLNDSLSRKAAGDFGRWIRAKGVILSGLQFRRACEKMLFEQQLKYSVDGVFHRDTCQSFSMADASGDIVDIDTGE
jgi:lysozyme